MLGIHFCNGAHFLCKPKQIVILQLLCRPRLSVKGRTLSFTYKALPELEASLVTTGGTVNNLVASQAANATGAPPAIATGSTYYNATLVVDVVGILSYVEPQAAQKGGYINVNIGEPQPLASVLHVTCCYGLLSAHIAPAVLVQVVGAAAIPSGVGGASSSGLHRRGGCLMGRATGLLQGAKLDHCRLRQYPTTSDISMC